MVDSLSPQERSRVMSSVKSKDTKPEKFLRSLLHKRGFRFRLHSKLLPGRPDIVLPKYRVIIFVHGCFWHGHPNQTCKLSRTPKSNIKFWTDKVESNRDRDEVNRQKLLELGWRVLTVWECSLHACRHDPSPLIDQIIEWLVGNSRLAKTTPEGELQNGN